MGYLVKLDQAHMTQLDMKQYFCTSVFYLFPSVIKPLTLTINVMCW